MKLSIITVCRNSAATIEDTIRSVAAQRFADVEYIVVDGASTDATLSIIEKHRRHVAKLVSEPDRGMFEAMNKGIAQATGDVIGFLNADDVYIDETVLDTVAAAFADGDVDACYADLIYVAQNDPERILRYWKSQPYVEGLFSQGWMPAHPTFFVRREIYEKYGGFNLNYPRQSDFELAMRFFLTAKVRTRYIPRVIVRMRAGGLSSGFAHIVLGNIEAYRACRKHDLNVTPLFILRKIFSRIPQFVARPSGSTHA